MKSQAERKETPMNRLRVDGEIKSPLKTSFALIRCLLLLLKQSKNKHAEQTARLLIFYKINFTI